MELYFVIMTLLTFLSMTEVIKIGRIEQKYIVVFFSVTCLFLGSIRYNTGTDWDSYYSYFIRGNSLEYFLEDSSFEIGYALINFLIKDVTNEYNYLLLVISCICIYCYYKSSTYLVPYAVTSAMIIFSAEFYGVFPVRTTIATALALLAYCMIAKKNKIGFIIVVLVATSIHKIGIILLPSYWLYYKKYKSAKMIIFMMICILIGSTNILFDIASSFTGIDFVYLSKFISYAERSQNGQQFGAAVDKTQLSYYMIAFKTIFIMVMLYFRKYLESKILNFNGLFNLYFAGTCLYFLLVFTSAEIAARLTGVYIIVQYLLMASLLDLSSKINIRLIVWSILTVSSVARLYFKFVSLPEAYVPFNTIFGILTY